MRPKERHRATKFHSILIDFDANVMPLPGLHAAGHLDCLVRQLIDSRRRVEFAHHIRNAQLHPNRMDPSSDIFDPLRAAVLYHRQGDVDEAYWLVFLATHFSKHTQDGWALARAVYGRLGGPDLWDWATISARPHEFCTWLAANQTPLQGMRFGSHRKYESLSPNSPNGTAAIIQSYVAWIDPPRTHQQMLNAVHQQVGQNPHEVFDHLYHSMGAVRRFGRLGRFDYLTMLGKLGITPVEPGSAYLWHNATGPLNGARLLFGGAITAKIGPKELDQKLILIDEFLGVGMQTLEDALCNWQKSPETFIPFRN